MTEDEFRKKIIFICGVDAKRMLLCKGKYNLYYRCPRYDRRNRSPGQKACTNRMSIRERNLLLDRLWRAYENSTFAPGLRGEEGDVVYEVNELNDFYITVCIINTRTVRQEVIGRDRDDV